MKNVEEVVATVEDSVKVFGSSSFYKPLKATEDFYSVIKTLKEKGYVISYCGYHNQLIIVRK